MQIFTKTFCALTMTCASFITASEYPWIPSWDLSSSEIGLSCFGGFESFRGIADSNIGDNNGAHVGAELASPVPYLSNCGIGFQLGGSVGAYDFAGRTSHHHSEAIQYQEFVTAGFFIYPSAFCPIGIGITSDWMFNQNYGGFAQSPTLQQYRAKVSYFVTPNDEMGFWGSYDGGKVHKVHNFGFIKSRLTYRPIAQLNFFWRHFFGGGVESNVWVGAPFRNRLSRIGSNRPGKYIVGAELSVPFFDSWALVGRGTFMQSGTKKGRLGAREYVSNIAVDLVYYFGGNPNANKSPAWSPYLPLANNSNFFVDVCTKSIDHKSQFNY